MLTRSKLIIFIIIGIVAFFGALAAAYFLIFGGDGGKNPPSTAQKSITIEFWGLFDDSDLYEPIFEAYTKTHPAVSIRYKKFIWDDYEPTLINALASQRGPDIFMIHNTWLGKHSDKLAPAPPGAMFDFIGQTVADLKKGKSIYGYPLFIDNLALFYNKDLFAKEGFSAAPQTWEQFTKYAKALTRFSPDGSLAISGAALGLDSKTINRASDILLLFMLQNGVDLYDAKYKADWQRDGKKFEAAKDALRFYTDFANPSKNVYSWNDSQEYSIDAFWQGNLGMMFNYGYNIETVKAKAPYLNFATAPLPRKGRTITLANYWAVAVSAQSAYKDDAWNFLKFFFEDEQYLSYIKETGRLSSRQKFLESQKDDPLLEPFIKQARFMKTPYQPDEKKVQDILDEMIRKVGSGELAHEQALKLGAERLQLLVK